MAAGPGPLESVRADTAVVVDEQTGAIMLSPASGSSAVGLVCIPGAQVEPIAYAAPPHLRVSPVHAERPIAVHG